MMKRRRSSRYRIVVKTKAQIEREKRIKAKKVLLERQRAMDAGEIYSGVMKVEVNPLSRMNMILPIQKKKKEPNGVKC